MKHFNSGNIFGKVLEVKPERSDNGKDYLQISMDVSGEKSGRVTAYCRLWDGDRGRCAEFMNEWQRFPNTIYWMKGFLGQYTSREGKVLSNFTIFQWERKETAEKRAVFILKGEVTSQPSGLNDGGQRFIMTVNRDGANNNTQSEEFELWAPGEKLFDQVAHGDLVEVKGLIRQKDVENFYGGSDGPIRAYVDILKIIPEQAATADDIPN